MIENNDEGVSVREDHDMIAAMDSNYLTMMTMMTMMTWSMPLEYWGVVGLACPCQPDKGGLQSSLSVLGLTQKEDEWIGEVLKKIITIIIVFFAIIVMRIVRLVTKRRNQDHLYLFIL